MAISEVLSPSNKESYVSWMRQVGEKHGPVVRVTSYTPVYILSGREGVAAFANPKLVGRFFAAKLKQAVNGHGDVRVLVDVTGKEHARRRAALRESTLPATLQGGDAIAQLCELFPWLVAVPLA